MRWKQHPQDPYLEVSRDGRVRYCVDTRSLSKGTIIPQRTTGRGYVFCSFHEPHAGTRQHHAAVHRLVAQSWIPNPLGLPFVHHKNHVKTDNRVGNLEWSTNSLNQKHALAAGRLPDRSGELCPTAKLNGDWVRLIRVLYYFGGCSQDHLGGVFGVSQTQIGRIVRRTRWRNSA